MQFSNARNTLRQRRICSASRMKRIPFFLCGNRTASELQPLEQPTVPSSRIDVLQCRNAARANSPDAPDASFERLLIRAVQAAKRSLSCSKPAIAACITPLTASRVISRPVHPHYSRAIHIAKRSLSCSKPASEPTGSPRHALRTPAHPHRSSSKTQPLMLKTAHCRPHNSFDGLSGCFKACTSALFARHPHDQTQPFMPETGQRAHWKSPTRPSNACPSAPFKQQNASSHA